MKTIAIITARGGSKRIPKKNIKEFCGKPIILYSIEAALNSRAFDEVMVSTDSKEIAEIAQKYGAAIPFLRSETTSNDFATTADVILEVLQRYKDNGMEFESFACIYPTAPFITSDKLAKALYQFNNTKSDAVISVVQYSFPPQRALIIQDGKIHFQYPEFEKSRSQDLEPIYHDAGQFYICSCKAFYHTHSLIQPNTSPFILPEVEVQDIDNISDWQIAEAKYTVLNNIRLL